MLNVLIFILSLRVVVDNSFLNINQSIEQLLSLAPLVIVSIFLIKKNRLKYKNLLIDYLFYMFIAELIFIVIFQANLLVNIETQKVLIKYFYFLILSVFIFNNMEYNKVYKILKYFFYLSIFIGFLQVIGILETYNDGLHVRVESIYGHPNAFANFLAITGFIFLSDYILFKRKNSLYLFFLAVIFIFLTQSRTATILLLSSLLLLLYKSNTISMRKKLLFFLVTGFILIIIFIFVKDRFLYEILQILEMDNIESIFQGNLNGSFSWRLFNWHNLVNIYLESNVLSGFGIGQTVSLNYEYTGNLAEAHNDYVRILVEKGLIGLTIHFFIIFLIVNKLKKYSKYKDTYTSILIFFICFQVTKFFDGLEESNILMLLLIAWTVTLSKIDYRRDS